MPMPKGHISINGNGTAKELGGITYHDVAKIMSDKGFKMNHSTARNVFITSLIKIASSITDVYDIDMSSKDLKKIAIDPRFQSAISEFMKMNTDDR
jgi:hypothetical protein